MDKILSYFKDKSYGFYVTLASILFTIITLSVYAVRYGNYDNYMSWESFYIMLVGAVLAIVAIVIKKYNWAPLALLVTNFIALLFYILNIYSYVTVVLVGIDVVSLSTNFIVCTVLFAINVVLSTANFFFKQVKNKPEATAQEGGTK